MGKRNKTRRKKTNNPRPAIERKFIQEKKISLLPWILLVLGISFLCLSPMLNNGFTNWDDEFYVQNNPLLKGPDWAGIFTQPVNDIIAAPGKYNACFLFYLAHFRQKRMGSYVYSNSFWNTSYACGVSCMGIRKKGCALYSFFSFIADCILEIPADRKIIKALELFFILCLVVIIETGSNNSSPCIVIAGLLERAAVQ